MYISFVDLFVLCILLLYSFYSTKSLNKYNNKLGYCIKKETLKLEYFFNTLVSTSIYFLYGITFYSIISILTITLCINLSFIDIKYMEISDETNCMLLLIGLLNIIINYNNAHLYFLGFLIGGGIYLIISASTNGAIGGGDIKLMSCLGLIFGYRATLFIMFTSCILSFISSIYFLIFKKNSIKQFIPFGPFICVSNIILLLFPNLLFYIL